MKLATLTAAVALLAAAQVAHAAPVLNNGNFDTPTTTYTANHQFGSGGSVPAATQGVTNWTGNNGYNIWFKTGTETTVSAVSQYSGGQEMLWSFATNPNGNGTGFVGLDGEQTAGVQGMISQTVTGLIVGGTYAVSFDWAGGQVQSRTGATTDKVSVTLGGETHVTNVINVASKGFSGWMTQVFQFTATSTSELLSFLSIGTPNGLPPMVLLDNVSISQVTQGPEPATLALLGAGLVGVGLVRRRRAAKRAAA